MHLDLRSRHVRQAMAVRRLGPSPDARGRLWARWCGSMKSGVRCGYSTSCNPRPPTGCMRLQEERIISERRRALKGGIKSSSIKHSGRSPEMCVLPDGAKSHQARGSVSAMSFTPVDRSSPMAAPIARGEFTPRQGLTPPLPPSPPRAGETEGGSCVQGPSHFLLSGLPPGM